MDDEVVFLTVDNVIKLHQDVIKLYSPGESLRISSPKLLDSATMTPQQTFGGEYLYSTFAEMAAAYAFGLALNHAFENGNKRVAFAACSTFLNMNGFRLNLSQDEATELTFGIVEHLLTRENVVEILDHVIEEIF